MSIPANYQNKMNNSQGKIMERMIEAACLKYLQTGEAFIEKTPEDFHPQSINRQTKKATGYYKAKAQPDFKGTLKGGRAICFEAKMTTKASIRQSVITDCQARCLDMHAILGAYCGVCVLINKTAAFIPWAIWKDMQKHFGKICRNILARKVYQNRMLRNLKFLCQCTLISFFIIGKGNRR